jgi:hypothetical protein
MQSYYPEVEENVPLPKNADEAFPALSPAEELEMRARTLKLLSDLSDTPIIPDMQDIAAAQTMAREMITNPGTRPNFAKYPNETIAYLAGMVAESNHMIVNELSDLKLYVVNRLVMEVENAKDSKSRISALAKLGEVDGVDAFKKRSEMVVKVQTIEEVEKELLGVLENIEYSVVDEEEEREELQLIPANYEIDVEETDETESEDE